MKELKSLYNGIINDDSIQRFSLGWKPIVRKLEKRYKHIDRTDEQFENRLIDRALSVTTGSLHDNIKCFAKELQINLQTLREKASNGK